MEYSIRVTSDELRNLCKNMTTISGNLQESTDQARDLLLRLSRSVDGPGMEEAIDFARECVRNCDALSQMFRSLSIDFSEIAKKYSGAERAVYQKMSALPTDIM